MRNGNGLVMLAERDVSSSLAALLISAVPLWVVLFRYVTGEKVPVGTLVGVLVGFVGVAILVMPGGSGGTSARQSMKGWRASDNIGFHRRSNAIVLDGLPLRPVPQSEPEKCPG